MTKNMDFLAFRTVPGRKKHFYHKGILFCIVKSIQGIYTTDAYLSLACKLPSKAIEKPTDRKKYYPMKGEWLRHT
jgi:hypothetical protein